MKIGRFSYEVSDNCRMCEFPGNGFLRQLPASALKDLDALKFVIAYPEDATLFVERHVSRGLYVLFEGEVKLSISSTEGKTLILWVAKPGDVLGLTATVAGIPYEATAETLCPCRVAFIRGDAFLRFLTQYPEAYPAVTKQLGAQYQVACEQLRTVALCVSTTERLARWLLEFSAAGRKTRQDTSVKCLLTHEEIGALIGTSRETVSRMFMDLKSENLAMIQNSNLVILDRPALERLAVATYSPQFSITGPARCAERCLKHAAGRAVAMRISKIGPVGRKLKQHERAGPGLR